MSSFAGDTHDFAAVSSANLSNPSLGRATTRSTVSEKTVSTLKHVGSRMKFWRRSSSSKKEKVEKNRDEDDEDRHQWRLFHRDTLRQMAAYDSPYPFVTAGGMILLPRSLFAVVILSNTCAVWV